MLFSEMNDKYHLSVSDVHATLIRGKILEWSALPIVSIGQPYGASTTLETGTLKAKPKNEKDCWKIRKTYGL